MSQLIIRPEDYDEYTALVQFLARISPDLEGWQIESQQIRNRLKELEKRAFSLILVNAVDSGAGYAMASDPLGLLKSGELVKAVASAVAERSLKALGKIDAHYSSQSYHEALCDELAKAIFAK